MRVALYAGVSGREQDIKVALRELRAYAVHRRWTVGGEYAPEMLGAISSRRALKRLLEAARRREFDILLVWKFDCFAQSTWRLLLTLEELQRLGIHFVSLTERIDTTSPLGEAIFLVLRTLVGFERDCTRNRARAALQKAQTDGKQIGRPPAIVDRQRISELQRQGFSFREIGRRLALPRSTVYKYRDRFTVEVPSGNNAVASADSADESAEEGRANG